MTPWVVASALLGWVGLFVHNLADLPGQSMLSVESFIPLLITCALVGPWFSRLRTGAAWLLLAWGILNLAGAIITVLPLAILPFDPDQSLVHYGFHLVYGIAQLPIVITIAIWFMRRRPGRSGVTKD